ncbi:MAG: hypothetical protein EBT30_05430 [Verrucomicrobia bacterium]|nr:hypothetical protein [Verrucomicrobiota bacterium]
MPPSLTKIEVRCPECGHAQLESENFISTVCRSCSFYFKSSLAAQPVRKKTRRTTAQKKELTCADCGAVQMVAEEALSSVCLECGRHLELGHRAIEGEHLGNLSLEGELLIAAKGNFGGAKARAARIVLQGRASGFLEAAEWLRVEGQSKIRSGASGERLEILAGASLEAADLLHFQSAVIEGELRCATIRLDGALRVGPHGKVIAEKILFSELTVDRGGRLAGWGEAREVAADSRGGGEVISTLEPG